MNITENRSIGENLKKIDTSKLVYVDNWAYATTIKGMKNLAFVYFVPNDESDKNLSRPTSNIIAYPYIALQLSITYAQNHEETFKKGIKETAQQLALDGFFEESLKVIPTSFYVFDKKFMDIFAVFYYKKSLRKSNLPEDQKTYLESLRLSTIEKQNKNWEIYTSVRTKFGNTGRIPASKRTNSSSREKVLL